ncbi:hypothetical protein, partial [Dysosmobacter sp.]|uniref:hypothetical protein n=1 Tax=Dysosmobacter sp. TaxID=2591382 RepID=UPI003AB60DCD
TVLTVPGFHNLFKVETLNLMQLGCVYLYAFASLLIIQLLKHRLTRAHREKQLKMSCQALHNAPPNRT